MKISFRQSGGFAGLLRGCEMDLDDVPAPLRAQLLKLMKHAAAKPSAGSSSARDQISYQIELDAPEGRKMLAFDDGSMPAGADDLVAFLQKSAKAIPPR